VVIRRQKVQRQADTPYRSRRMWGSGCSPERVLLAFRRWPSLIACFCGRCRCGDAGGVWPNVEIRPLIHSLWMEVWTRHRSGSPGSGTSEAGSVCGRSGPRPRLSVDTGHRWAW
jgi:hypothetical protein